MSGKQGRDDTILQAESVARYRPEPRRLESAEHRVVEPVEVLGTELDDRRAA